ncbi:MAG: acyl transferase/acyl hydrolase/lysophospholipase [Monoraphidium minutum]|nr:MAG: acyl transferase/acyl hydrolase/lysophospholipase [Monoraphidium minutum]
MQSPGLWRTPQATSRLGHRGCRPHAPRAIGAQRPAARGARAPPPSGPGAGPQQQQPGAPPPATPPPSVLSGLAARLEAVTGPRRGGSPPRGASPLSSVDPEEAAAEAAAAARAAFENDSLGFGFSAGGLLFPFYCGVVEELTSLGVIRENTPLAGASAGSLIVACARSGLPMSTILEACYALAADCRAKGTRFRLGPVLEGVLQELLPPGAAASASGRTYVAVTRVLPRDGPLLAPELVGHFKDKSDLIEALMTSCHIPVYMNGRLTTRFRGTSHFDGGITNFLPAPPGVDHAVRVCCLPSKQLSALGSIHISPDIYSPWPYSMGEMLGWAFEPAEQGMLEELVERGRGDARAWAAASGVGPLAAAAAARAPAAAAAARGGGLVLP